MLVGAFVFRPSSFDERWQQMQREIEDVREGRLASGSSIVPRFVFIKHVLSTLTNMPWEGWEYILMLFPNNGT